MIMQSLAYSSNSPSTDSLWPPIEHYTSADEHDKSVSRIFVLSHNEPGSSPLEYILNHTVLSFHIEKGYDKSQHIMGIVCV